MKTHWSVSGNKFSPSEVSHQQKELPSGVYRVDLYEPTNSIFLSRTDEEFKMPAKVYGDDKLFVDRCIKTYGSTTGNLGILFNGTKGTGKTLAAQMISNRLGLPVLVVRKAYEGIPSFINNIQQDVVVFVDEYEKIYNNYDHTILTLMDGVLSTVHRRVFLLTTNDAYVNENMLQRPSRIRYVRSYGDLSREAISEIVDDLLIHDHLKEDTVEYLSTLERITMDIVKVMVDEVNIHGESPKAFGSYFNTKCVDNNVAIFTLSEGPDGVAHEKLTHPKAIINPSKITQQSIGQHLTINGQYVGSIRQVVGSLITYENHDDEMVTIRTEPREYKHMAWLTT